MGVLCQPPDLADPAGFRRNRLSVDGAVAPPLPFRAVNRRGAPGHDPGLQRHHLLPRQVLAMPAFSGLFAAVPPTLLGFDDFRRNGLLLPANQATARRLALPLHRGPHRLYNAMVIERIGGIERDWSHRRRRDPYLAHSAVLFRVRLLQRALRRRLLTPARPRPTLNRHDPLLDPALFQELDALAEQLWWDTEPRRPRAGWP